MKTEIQYTRQEEIFNSLTHGIGALLAVLGTIIIVKKADNNNVAMIMSVLIYGLTMIGMYSMSTLYHFAKPGKMKNVMQIFDHASIYLLIAGCYTPVTLILLGGTGKALIMFAVVWIAAVAGIILNVVDMKKFKRVGMLLYLIMGWTAIVDIKNIIQLMGNKGATLMIAGGLSYTIGIIFYRMKQTKYMHCIWHLFVLAGSIFHYICILNYVVLVF